VQYEWSNMNDPIRLGVIGLGRAFTLMLPTLSAHPLVRLVAAYDPRPDARGRFAADFAATAHESAEALCSDPSVEAIYIASPHQFHVEHVKLAAQRGKHVLVEKPMALSVPDCVDMIGTARAHGIWLLVGHSHSYDGPYLRARALISSGAYGRVCMINALNFTDFLYRPRRPEELDTRQGGGVVFSQAAHQVDIVRLLAGQPATTVRAFTGKWDPRRPTEGAYNAQIQFVDGAFASLTYSGYGHFDSDEFQGWIGEMGKKKAPYAAPPRPRFADAQAESSYKNGRNYGGAAYQAPADEAPAHQHFGTVLVSCERADLRALPNGVMIYQNGAAWLEPLPPPTVPRAEVIDELYQAVVHGEAPLHDGAWGMATLEVVLAILRSAREGREVTLGC
jgi:phthalate 4,5-cis-dihydrodiol dehydrogenase